MSDVNVPVTDAFSGGTSFETLEVELTPKQVEWLRSEAAERDLSVDHVLRSLITDQIRARSTAPGPDAPPKETDAASDANDPTEETRDEAPSIVESLRSANERLQELTDDDPTESAAERPSTPPPPNRSRGENKESSVLVEDQGPSMFDLMDEKTEDE